ncbi:hypothetical protein [Caulobacter sp. DWR1-3-2b1]|uniref:hypothetical protein n=1 Tax=Caulobacter sp. DWR1-3-2b1 TaxID=2804670 RepID=UPI003CEB5B1D
MTSAAARNPRNRARRGGSLKLHRGGGFGEVLKLQTVAKSHAPQGVAALLCERIVPPIIIGVGPNLVRKAGRGGARNRADRVSHALTTAQVANLLDAIDHAKAVGLPLNRMITIHWKSAGVPQHGIAKATGRFTDLLSKCLARHGHRAAWVWVHENGDFKGWHCHLLAHVPPVAVRQISKLQKRWLRSITGRPYRARVIHSRPIGGRLGAETSIPAVHAFNLEIAASYILKGAQPSALDLFALRGSAPGGLIVGKRCSTSSNIGAAARKSWNLECQGR